MACHPQRPASGADCIRNRMRSPISRRRFVSSTAAGILSAGMPHWGEAKLATKPPPKQVIPDEFSAAAAAPVPIEVKAHPIPFFDPSDHARVRFGSLEYRSGLVLTSSFPGFGGLSGLRLDPKAHPFISFTHNGNRFTPPSAHPRRPL